MHEPGLAVEAGTMNVYWLGQSAADVPVLNNWLSAGELARLKGMRFEKRRADFRLGRGTAICAIAASGVALGCDLEVIEPRSDAFLADYFTTEEQEFVACVQASERSQILALLWSAKESALKALREGLRLDTRSLRVEAVAAEMQEEGQIRDSALTSCPSFVADIWHPLYVRFGADQVFQGWWQHANDVLRTMVATPFPSQPILLVITK